MKMKTEANHASIFSYLMQAAENRCGDVSGQQKQKKQKELKITK